MIVLLLALAGGAGATARFVVDAVIARHSRFRFPLGTMVVNVSGSLLLGFLTGLALYQHGAALAPDLKAVLGTGFCGGYTTFSTASVETFRLWTAEGPASGAGYGVATLLGSVGAAALGLWSAYLL